MGRHTAHHGTHWGTLRARCLIVCAGMALPGFLFVGASASAQDQFRFGEPSVGRVRDGQIQSSPVRASREQDRNRAGTRQSASSRQQDRHLQSLNSHSDHRSSGGTYRRSAIDPDGDGKGFVYRASVADERRWGSDRYDSRTSHRYNDRGYGSWNTHRDHDWHDRSRSGVRVSFGTSSHSHWNTRGWNDCDEWSDARWSHDPYSNTWGWQRVGGWQGAGGWQDPWATYHPYGVSHASQTIVVTDPIYVQESVYSPEPPVVVVREVVEEQRTVIVRPPAERQTTVVVSRPSVALVSEAIVRADRGDHVRAATQMREFARTEGRVPAFAELDRGARRALDRVIRDYEARSTGYEASADTFFVLGMSYAIRGEHERARAALDAAHSWGDRDAGTRQIRQWLQRR